MISIWFHHVLFYFCLMANLCCTQFFLRSITLWLLHPKHSAQNCTYRMQLMCNHQVDTFRPLHGTDVVIMKWKEEEDENKCISVCTMCVTLDEISRNFFPIFFFHSHFARCASNCTVRWNKLKQCWMRRLRFKSTHTHSSTFRTHATQTHDAFVSKWNRRAREYVLDYMLHAFYAIACIRTISVV